MPWCSVLGLERLGKRAYIGVGASKGLTLMVLFGLREEEGEGRGKGERERETEEGRERKSEERRERKGNEEGEREKGNKEGK